MTKHVLLLVLIVTVGCSEVTKKRGVVSTNYGPNHQHGHMGPNHGYYGGPGMQHMNHQGPHHNGPMYGPRNGPMATITYGSVVHHGTYRNPQPPYPNQHPNAYAYAPNNLASEASSHNAIIAPNSPIAPNQVAINTINQPVPVPVPAPYPVPVNRPYPVPVPHAVPVEIPRPVTIPVPQPIQVTVPKPYPVTINKPIPVPVPVTQFYPVPQPVKIEVPYPVTVVQSNPNRHQPQSLYIGNNYEAPDNTKAGSQVYSYFHGPNNYLPPNPNYKQY